MKTHHLNLSLLVCGALLLSSCDQESSNKSDEFHRSVIAQEQIESSAPKSLGRYYSDDGSWIHFREGNEVEITESGEIVLGEFTREEENLRVVFTALGTKIVRYFSPAPDGITDLSENEFYWKQELRQVAPIFKELRQIDQKDIAAQMPLHRRAFRLGSQHSANAVAWNFATAPDPIVSQEEGLEAARFLLQRAPSNPRWAQAQYLDTVAAAFAKAGDFRKAASVQRDAIEHAVATLKEELHGELRDRLRLYEDRKPYVETGK